MKTRLSLLLASASMAAVVPSFAQTSNLYSVNAVGYVVLPFPSGQLVLVENPLDNGTNTVSSWDQGLPNKTAIQIWTGAGFFGATKTAGSWSSNFLLAPGTGFFLKSFGGFTNTFIGQTPNSNSLALPAGLNVLVGSPTPISGNLNDSGPNTLNLLSLPNKSSIQVWNGAGYNGTTKSGGTWSTNMAIAVGQGFFMKANSATNLVQTLQ